MNTIEPTLNDIHKAKMAFDKHEPRRLFYRVATELVEMVLKRKTALSLAEALAVLLQTWNQAYYRFKPFDQKHYRAIDKLLRLHEVQIHSFRVRHIYSLTEAGRKPVQELFSRFESVLGAVGAAKSLHLLAPFYFPLWDRKIARAYGIPIRPRGQNASGYMEFMFIMQRQCARFKHDRDIARNPLKALDEYNYCKLTKGWI